MPSVVTSLIPGSTKALSFFFPSVPPLRPPSLSFLLQGGHQDTQFEFEVTKKDSGSGVPPSRREAPRGRACRRKRKLIFMKLLSRVRVNMSICLLICSLGFPLVHWQRHPSATENQKQKTRALHRHNPCNHKTRLLTHPTFSARVSPCTSQNLGYSFLCSWESRSYIQASHKGLWRNPMFPSTCLCGVSLLETLSLICYRGRGSPNGQSLVEKYKSLSGIN